MNPFRCLYLCLIVATCLAGCAGKNDDTAQLPLGLQADPFADLQVPLGPDIADVPAVAMGEYGQFRENHPDARVLYLQVRVWGGGVEDDLFTYWPEIEEFAGHTSRQRRLAMDILDHRTAQARLVAIGTEWGLNTEEAGRRASIRLVAHDPSQPSHPVGGPHDAAAAATQIAEAVQVALSTDPADFHEGGIDASGRLRVHLAGAEEAGSLWHHVNIFDPDELTSEQGARHIGLERLRRHVEARSAVLGAQVALRTGCSIDRPASTLAISVMGACPVSSLEGLVELSDIVSAIWFTGLSPSAHDGDHLGQ